MNTFTDYENVIYAEIDIDLYWIKFSQLTRFGNSSRQVLGHHFQKTKTTQTNYILKIDTGTLYTNAIYRVPATHFIRFILTNQYHFNKYHLGTSTPIYVNKLKFQDGINEIWCMVPTDTVYI